MLIISFERVVNFMKTISFMAGIAIGAAAATAAVFTMCPDVSRRMMRDGKRAWRSCKRMMGM